MPGAHDGRAYTRLEDVDWANWISQERATLLFVIRHGHILLIHKKRGLGAGKIIGPGGRLDPGESALQSAIREAQEELKITPTGVRQCGELSFQFVDGLSICVYVFTAQDCEGEPQETDEAAPLWIAVEQIPYDHMWADDRVWFPLMLAGQRFQGRFLFDGRYHAGPPSDHERLKVGVGRVSSHRCWGHSKSGRIGLIEGSPIRQRDRIRSPNSACSRRATSRARLSFRVKLQTERECRDD
jgi:8-oxo-dGTP diphosphatase